MKYKNLSDFEIKELVFRVQDIKEFLQFIEYNSSYLFHDCELEEKEFMDVYYDIIFSKRKLKLDDFFRKNLEIIVKALDLYRPQGTLSNIRELDKIRRQYTDPNDLYSGISGLYYNYLFCYAYYYDLAPSKLDEICKYYSSNEYDVLDWASLNGFMKPFSVCYSERYVSLLNNECYFHVTQHIIAAMNIKEIR